MLDIISVTGKTLNLFHPLECRDTRVFCYPAAPGPASAHMSRPDVQGHSPRSHTPRHQSNWGGLCNPLPPSNYEGIWGCPPSFSTLPLVATGPASAPRQGAAPPPPRGRGPAATATPARLGSAPCGGGGHRLPGAAGRRPEPSGDSLGDSLLRQADRAPSSPQAGAGPAAPPGT